MGSDNLASSIREDREPHTRMPTLPKLTYKASWEYFEVDPRYGGFLNADLADYVLSVNVDIGAIEVEVIDRPDPLVNAMGIKGLGEVAMVGVAAAIANAVIMPPAFGCAICRSGSSI
jgi:hypothetical protein